MTDATISTNAHPSSARSDHQAYGEAGEHAAAVDDLLTGKLDVDATPSRPPGLSAPEACPAFQIGAQIGRLTAQHSDLDQAGVLADKDEEWRRGAAMDRATASRWLLQEAMTYAAPTSVPGALAQLVVGAQFILQTIESASAGEDERMARSALRCVYGAAAVLASAGGISARRFGSDYLMPGHLDALSRAWGPALSSTIVSGPKPTVDLACADTPGSVEQQLVAFNQRANEWWAVYHDSGRKETEADEAEPRDIAKKLMAEQAAAHAVRIARENLIRAMALPATTARELGLQARLIAVELSHWWDDNNQSDGEIACRALLDRLITSAGLEHIPDGCELKPAEVIDWLANPQVHAPRYNPELREGRK